MRKITQRFDEFLKDESGGLKFPHILLIVFVVIVVWAVYGIKTTEFGKPHN